MADGENGFAYFLGVGLTIAAVFFGVKSCSNHKTDRAWPPRPLKQHNNTIKRTGGDIRQEGNTIHLAAAGITVRLPQLTSEGVSLATRPTGKRPTFRTQLSS